MRSLTNSQEGFSSLVIKNLELDGIYLVENFYAHDERGSFIKMFNESVFLDSGITDTAFKEIYYSASKKNTIRGMHFQMPPHEHSKLIYLTSGSVIDVVVDLRKKSSTYGKYTEVELKAHKDALFISLGFAHGFKDLENNTIMIYNQTSGYNLDADTGIRYDSFGYDWKVHNPILSERDKRLIEFSKFCSPF